MRHDWGPNLRMHLHICNEWMQFDGGEKCERFVWRRMHGKEFILHINAYFRVGGILETFCMFRRKMSSNQLFYIYFQCKN